MKTKPQFVEKQYLGRDYGRISIRMVMALFCFAAYYITERREQNADLFLVVGCGILIVSIIMMFLLHYRTTVIENAIVIDGLWSTSKVTINLNSIIKVEKTHYSTFFFNNPVYNLHNKGTIRFYAGGKDAIKLTDRDGMNYMIGTQYPEEFDKQIHAALSSTASFSGNKAQ